VYRSAAFPNADHTVDQTKLFRCGLQKIGGDCDGAIAQTKSTLEPALLGGIAAVVETGHVTTLALPEPTMIGISGQPTALSTRRTQVAGHRIALSSGSGERQKDNFGDHRIFSRTAGQHGGENRQHPCRYR
jgi:hypothetical protein